MAETSLEDPWSKLAAVMRKDQHWQAQRGCIFFAVLEMLAISRFLNSSREIGVQNLAPATVIAIGAGVFYLLSLSPKPEKSVPFRWLREKHANVNKVEVVRRTVLGFHTRSNVWLRDETGDGTAFNVTPKYIAPLNHALAAVLSAET